MDWWNLIGIIDIYLNHKGISPPKIRFLAWTSSAFAQWINSLATKALTSGGFERRASTVESYGLVKPKWEEKLEC